MFWSPRQKTSQVLACLKATVAIAFLLTTIHYQSSVLVIPFITYGIKRMNDGFWWILLSTPYVLGACIYCSLSCCFFPDEAVFASTRTIVMGSA